MRLLNLLEAARRLVRLGYLAKQAVDAADADGSLLELAAMALREYQEFHGLDETGVLDRHTQRLLIAPRCGCADREAVTEGGLCKWGDSVRPVRYWLDPALPRLSTPDWRAVARDAFAAWTAVCDIEFERVERSADANWQIVPHRHDGSSGVLADQELPCGVETRKAIQMRVDRDELWTAGREPGRIRALNVLCHEIGHGIGISHVAPSRGQALMNPTYDPSVPAPLELDVAEARARYGKPKPPPVPPGDQPSGDEFVLRLRGQFTIDGHRVLRLPTDMGS